MKKTDESTCTIKEETFEFDNPPEDATSDTYTRKSIGGELECWIPHDGYGPLQFGTTKHAASEQLETVLEGRYKAKKSSDNELIRAARSARETAFAPYSNYEVGAAVLTDVGMFEGANVEVSGRSTSIHAEMLAMYNAVRNGATEFYGMAVSPQDQSGDVAPCGLCQHTMSQFTEELRIIEDAGDNGDHGIFWLSELIGDGYSASTRHMDTLKS